eukprot:COSAG02_NODE_41788_length_391_cov_0.534247_1_plen_83_part_01
MQQNDSLLGDGDSSMIESPPARREPILRIQLCTPVHCSRNSRNSDWSGSDGQLRCVQCIDMASMTAVLGGVAVVACAHLQMTG